MRIAHNTTFVFTAFTVPYLILLLFAGQAKSDIVNGKYERSIRGDVVVGEYDHSIRGVIALKKTRHDFGSRASLHLYGRVIIENGLPIKISKNGQFYKIERPDLAEYIELPKVMPQILTDAEKADFRASYSKIKIFLNKYRQLRPMREAYFERLEKTARNIDRGFVFYGGNWLTKEAYQGVIERQAKKALAEEAKEQRRIEEVRWRALKEQAKEQRRLEEWRLQQARERQDQLRRDRVLRADAERIRKYEAEQKAKGLVYYDYHWISKVDADIKKAIKERSVYSAKYRISQVFEDGSTFVKLSNGDWVYIADMGWYEVLSDTSYKDDLYYCGVYRYENVQGDLKIIARYCINPETAFALLKAEADGAASNSGPRSREPENDNPPSASGIYSGSGFFIGNQGYFITNHHVIGKSKSVKISHKNNSYNAKVIKVSAISDLALLKVADKLRGLPIHKSDITVGSDIYAYGFPQTDIQGRSPKVTKGIISSSKGFKDDITRYQIDAAIQPGNSGGPLCCANGIVCGVVVSSVNAIKVAELTGSIPQNVNYAIKSSEVLALLRSAGLNLDAFVPARELDKSSATERVINALGLVTSKQ